jgi:hypothetical protein
MVPLIARAASPQALLSLRYIEGTYFRIRSPRDACGEVDKVMAGGTPANPAALVVDCQHPKSLAISILWTSDVPSPISLTLTSRQYLATG